MEASLSWLVYQLSGPVGNVDTKAFRNLDNAPVVGVVLLFLPLKS